MTDPADQINYDDARALLRQKIDWLRDLDTAISAAGSDSGIREERRIAVAEVDRLKEIVAQWDQPSRQESPLEQHPVVLALPDPPPVPRPAIRAERRETAPAFGKHVTAVGQFGRALPPPSSTRLNGEANAGIAASPSPQQPLGPLQPAGAAAALTPLPEVPRVTISVEPNGAVVATIDRAPA